MGPSDQQHQQHQQQLQHQLYQQQRRLHASDLRRRAGYLSTGSNSNITGNTDGNSAMPGLDQGSYSGFNGIVFGSGGQTDLSNIMSSRLGYDNGASAGNDGLGIYSGQGLGRFSEPSGHAVSSRQNHNVAMEHVFAMQRENQALRRQNEALQAASDARQRTALKLLHGTLGHNAEDTPEPQQGADNAVQRNQLSRLLLALLDTPAGQDSVDDSESIQEQLPALAPAVTSSLPPPPPPPAAAASVVASRTSLSSAPTGTAARPLPNVFNSKSPLLLPTPSDKFRRRNSQSSVRPLSIARGAAGSVHIDWDSSALLEIANHGKISDEEPRIDRYASESRKAIGAYSSTAITRRNMSLSRRHSSLKSNNSAPSPSAQHHEGAIPGAFPGDPTSPVSSSKDEFQPNPSSFEFNSPKEGAYLYQDEPLECAANKMGSLAASLLAPSESRFDPNPKSRFVLYSPSAGIFESRNLDGLRSGDLTLADIIEASSKSITLDQLQSDRASTQDDSHSSQGGPIPSCPASGCFWMDVTNPTPEEMASLARVFGIHPLTVEDIMADDDSRDKFETFSGYNFLMYRTIDYGDDAKSTYEFNRGTEGIATASFSIILKHSCVLTFHSARELDHVGNVISRLRDLAPLSTTSLAAIQPVVTPAYIAYALVDDITDTLAPEMRSIELEIDAVDELVLILSTNEQADMLKRIGAARRKILTVWRLLQGKPDVIRSFSKLMERQAVADDMLRAELEDAEYMRRMMDTSAPQAPAYSEGASAAPPANTGLHMSLSSSALALPQTTLRRNTHSSTAIPLLATGSATGSGAARRKDPPLWQTYITGNLNVKDSQPLSSQPSTVDLPTGATRGDTMGPVTADEVAHYLSDVYDHLVSLVGSSSHCDMVLSRAHSNYLARISLELGESTVETNLFASRWTVIGAILVPLNVVTGLWGMNVKVPGRDRDDVLDFFMILTGCLVFVAVVIVWARYKKIF